MKLPNWCKVVWWLILLGFASTVLWQRYAELVEGKQYTFDIIVLLVWLALMLCPLFSEINLFGLQLKQEIQSLRSDVSRDLASVKNEVRMGISITNYLASGEQRPVAAPNEQHGLTVNRSRIEYMILNTLWTKQVNRYDDASQVWTFRINDNAPVFLEYRDASTKLIREGFVRELQNGHLCLTESGFDYCKSHYQDFPPEQWWPGEELDQERLKTVLKKS